MLPLRFGMVMATAEAVAGDLLAVYHEAFSALKQFEGRARGAFSSTTIKAVLTFGRHDGDMGSR